MAVGASAQIPALLALFLHRPDGAKEEVHSQWKWVFSSGTGHGTPAQVVIADFVLAMPICG
ncbi:MAG: hypothetical protein ACXW3Z_15530 [Limisphaerales bacterium]